MTCLVDKSLSNFSELGLINVAVTVSYLLSYNRRILTKVPLDSDLSSSVIPSFGLSSTLNRVSLRRTDQNFM